MNEYRCTRNAPYNNPHCLGVADLSARSGYYITAATEQEAIAIMAQLYPNDDAGFTAQPWKTDCPKLSSFGQGIHTRGNVTAR